MFNFPVRNVNDGFATIVIMFAEDKEATIQTESRNGPVLMMPHPVCVSYERPTERVLFNVHRDANPFFHLYEAMWMLAGRNDLKPLQYFVSTFDNFSDDGRTLNGAYGYRWRHAAKEEVEYDCGLGTLIEQEDTDQLKLLIDHLKTQPGSRRAVLQMWNVEDDLLKIDTSKDVCCNLSVCFLITETNGKKELNMTVFNRSNDLILGLLGANAVHFSFLQEYIAGHLGIAVGRYYQVTNNLHVYLNSCKFDEWLSGSYAYDPYVNFPSDYLCPLISDPVRFDKELPIFVEQYLYPSYKFEEPFFHCVAVPMLLAFKAHKERDYTTALKIASEIKSQDWHQACKVWLLKRAMNYSNRTQKA